MNEVTVIVERGGRLLRGTGERRWDAVVVAIWSEGDPGAAIQIEWPDGHGWDKFSAERGDWVLRSGGKVVDEGRWYLEPNG